MKGHGTQFGRKKEEAIVALLTQRNVEEAAKSIGLAPNTLLKWMKDPEFDAAFRKARRLAHAQSVARMHQACSAAVTTVVKIMVDVNAPASVRLRAADILLERTAKSIETDDIEARLTELERTAELSKQG